MVVESGRTDPGDPPVDVDQLLVESQYAVIGEIQKRSLGIVFKYPQGNKGRTYRKYINRKFSNATA
jgi:hypothetical protein